MLRMIAKGSEGGAIIHLGDCGEPRVVGELRRATQIAAQDLMVADALDQRRIEREALHALREPRSSLRGVCRADQDQEPAPARAVEQRSPDRATEKTGGAGEQKGGLPRP